jgi:hypothetical protein
MHRLAFLLSFFAGLPDAAAQAIALRWHAPRRRASGS